MIVLFENEFFEAAELTYKPNSVLASLNASGNHSSWRRITAPLSATYPKTPRAETRSGRISLITFPYLVLHRRGFA